MIRFPDNLVTAVAISRVIALQIKVRIYFDIMVLRTDSLVLIIYVHMLVPSTYSSGGTTYHGSITKRGSKYLLWIMLECVHVHIGTNKNSNMTQFYTG